jgi:hypothetical protein
MLHMGFGFAAHIPAHIPTRAAILYSPFANREYSVPVRLAQLSQPLRPGELRVGLSERLLQLRPLVLLKYQLF